MPVMPRAHKKAREIAWNILPKPPNMRKKRQSESEKRDRDRLYHIETRGGGYYG